MTLPADLRLLKKSFVRHLRAENKAEGTIEVYCLAIDQFGEYLDALGPEPVLDHDGDLVAPAGPARIEELTKDHILGWIDHLQHRKITFVHKPPRLLSESTVSQRYRSLRAWVTWLVEEGELDRDPMARIDPPAVAEIPVPVLSVDQERALLGTCGKGRNRAFVDVRDEALLRLFMDSGPRRKEVIGLALGDVDLDFNVALVTGKGNRDRSLPFGANSARALDRYLRARSRHRLAALDALWLAAKGPLTAGGAYQMVRRRGSMIGIEGLHPHQFRHTFSHQWLANGGSETDLMRLNGWTSRSMLSRYGASAADERARAAHHSLNLGDRL